MKCIANRSATTVKLDVRLSAQANARAFYQVRIYICIYIFVDYISLYVICISRSNHV